LHSQAPEVLISGPAGTGKSVAALMKLHIAAELKPGFRGLILRKTRASLTESALVSFERFVLPPGHPARRGASRRLRQSYEYPNGSTIVTGGLDNAERAAKVLSTEYDLVYIQEAIEVDEGTWETLTTRLRTGTLRYQQLLADTNPDRPTHWLKRRCDAGKTQLIESRHEDNPLLWDAARGAWTPFGLAYLEKLDRLTGPRKLRLRYGRWVQSEGVVYEGWDAAVHVIDRFPIPREWPRLWSVDFGYTNPFVCLFFAIDDDNRLYRYREIYMTRRLVEDHARFILEVAAKDPAPVAIVCDHDAEDRATLERHLGMPTTPAVKTRRAGIQAVAARLRKAGDGRARVFFLRDSLVERDPELVERKLPTCLEEEVDGYVWDTRLTVREGEEPVKENDHSMDALRYAVASLDLEQLAEGESAPTVLRVR
jgi:phage terminase large subunit